MILVTGSTGLLGNNVVRQLIESGQRVRVLCRPTTSLQPIAGLDVDVIIGELNDPSDVSRATAGCSAVIHCAAMIQLGQTKLEESRRVNVLGTLTLAKQCIELGVRLVHVSTVDTFDVAPAPNRPIDERNQGGLENTPCSYVISKRECEQELWRLIEQSGLDAVIVNPGYMLGPNDWKPSSGTMMLEVVRKRLHFAPPGACSVCDARDVAAAAISSITRGRCGERYILGGENLYYADFWRKMLLAAGKQRFIYRMKPRLRHLGPIIDRVKQLRGRDEGQINGTSLAMSCLFHCYDSSKAKHELGYTNRNLEDTLLDSWQWLDSHHSPT